MAEVNRIKLSKDQVNFLNAWATIIHMPHGTEYYVINKYWFLNEYDRVFYIIPEAEISDEAKGLLRDLTKNNDLSDYKFYGHLLIPVHDINQGFCTPRTLEGQELSSGYGYVVSDDATICPMYIDERHIIRETNPIPGPCPPGVYKLWRKNGSF